ncbi:hypothetical protein EVAR_16034_1 [Eumeta japonica]|uniref:Secreted protein n=1 Tax=Eumeta variegata TaxID=151549 RepID=A0A4C1VXX1_EUMVA|nr:hypothetical protein EVAR_16034_1 [Eumeta japonica]
MRTAGIFILILIWSPIFSPSLGRIGPRSAVRPASSRSVAAAQMSLTQLARCAEGVRRRPLLRVAVISPTPASSLTFSSSWSKAVAGHGGTVRSPGRAYHSLSRHVFI